ncbi:class I SAM-dependent methyltransferase [Aliiroseovarius subalbicans]|uniref:class I SAM-dependent methyltransferase n=1 Tax=Aliiroseovarius subalbicans TaxID=2925840 RepID=UPI001F59AC28|nr:class I SAM-dependent methyltransferase [Aliiroseovarius subalbicans]MCI2401181.1 class I SAM-dependent methyltransferase [Aliiroseovarius subalbicans]
MSDIKSCPACGGRHVSEIYRLDAIPVQSCILLDSEEEARAFPRRPLVLMFCDGCGFIYNRVFDLAMVDYASTTEESQHFSGTFNRFARDLVAEIAGLYDLGGQQTLEIGCGKGDFLQELARQTGTRALGVDPGFIPERLPGADGHDISFQREYFDPATITEAPDFVVCRHTLEHVPEVGRFMHDIARVIDGRQEVGIFFETPDVRRVLEEGAFWDIYYEHCSYFTLGSHARLFRREGMDVNRLYLAYDDQYIIQYAAPGAGKAALPQEEDLDAVRALAAAFPEKVAAIRRHWTDFVRSRHRDGKRVAIWGGGSKGVSFLTTNGLGEEVAQVIDINPFKQGKYLPGTGHLVSAPEDLTETPPDTVIVMNPIYLPEIGAQLADMGLEPELVAV